MMPTCPGCGIVQHERALCFVCTGIDRLLVGGAADHDGGVGTVTYFVQAVGGGPIKIGKTSGLRLATRLSALNTSSPFRLRVTRVVQGDWEKMLHMRFGADRLHGEWFKPTDQVVAVANARPIQDPALRHLLREAYAAGWSDGIADLRGRARDRCPLGDQHPHDLRHRARCESAAPIDRAVLAVAA